MLLTEFNTVNFSPSCERNKHAIAEQLLRYFKHSKSVLEIGSLSGQHAAHFAPLLPHLRWQPSDLAENVRALTQNIANSDISNIEAPIALDVSHRHLWPEQKYDGIFSANSLHIMSWSHVECFFKNLQQCLVEHAVLCIYGPFKYQGEFTSRSNANFDLWLKDRDMVSGVRDFEMVHQLAEDIGFSLKQDINMPANNQLLIWQRKSGSAK
ncbi:DUF938 domain-containing protein [Thalassotalea sp. ND16A]|uniref:DUF938 domain-containing protein n=1 Tax=Thalassotalea sp. ND16A TaxID=1535422 RepID=UPI00051DCF2A|nr:DUF938 domain-containing protein [Thalassotalea sp. ND16A]KGJ98003.1 hypothetical protein ND16A_0808 [Thalassotalea sp. ND16A]